MQSTCSSRRWWMKFALCFAIWTLLGLFHASESYFRYAYAGQPITWGQALALDLSLWYAWAVLSIFVFQLARRFPIEQRKWPVRVLLHAAFSAFFALVKIAMDYPIIEAFYCPLPGLLPVDVFFRMAFASQFHSYVLIYWALLGVSHALNYYRKYRERELRASILEARLAQTELRLLQTQLQPHFLFNTLNSISALIHKDVEVADQMLARLGDLLRLSLEYDGAEEVTLAQELEFVRTYLEIEAARYGPRLRVQWDVEPQAQEARVPYLLLQPLVENALRHGIARRPRGGLIEIRAERVEERLHLQVCDNGPGIESGKMNGHRQGIGLANTQARLQQLYGDEYRFALNNRPSGGALASIELPFCPELTTPPSDDFATASDYLPERRRLGGLEAAAPDEEKGRPRA